MKSLVTILFSLSILFLFFAGVTLAPAANITSAGSGNWNSVVNNAPWPGGVVPGASDNVTISAGNTVTVTAGASCATLTISSGGAAGVVNINGGITLAVSGAVSVQSASTNNNTNSLNVGAGTLNAASIDVAGSNGMRHGAVTVSTGTINCTGALTFSGNTGNAHFTFTGAGTLNIGGNLGGGGNFTASTGTVNFNGSAAQTFDGGYTYNTVKANNTAGVSPTSAVTISNLTIGDVTANSLFSDNGNQVTAAGTLNLTSGTLQLGSAGTATTFPGFTTVNISAGTTVSYVSGVAQTVSRLPNYSNLTFSGAGTKNISPGTLTVNGNWSVGSTTALNGTANVAGNFTLTGGTFTAGANTMNVGGNWTNNGGTFSAGTGAVNFNGSSAQTIGGTQSTTFNNLTLNNGAGASLSASVTVNGTMTLTSGTLSVGANTLSLNGPAIAGTPGNLSTTSSSSLSFGGSSVGVGIPSSVTALNNLTINNPNGVALNSDLTVSGTLALTNGTLSIGAHTLTVTGSTTQTGGSLGGGPTSNISITGGAGNATVSGGTFNNVTMNRSGGATLSGDLTVDGTLSFTSGVLTTGANTVIVAAGGSVTGAGSGTYVNGNLEKVFSTGAQSFTFDVGDATNYTPVALAFANVSTGGNVTVHTTAGQHPNIATSGINSSRDVARYWTLTQGGGLVFTTYDAAFTFVPGDVIGGANTGNFVVRKFNPSTWTVTTTGTKTATSTQATGLASFSDFAIGEQLLDHFVLSLGGPQTNAVAFTGTNTLTAQDVLNAAFTAFDASADNVTMAANSPLSGAVSGLSGANKLTGAGDFTSGVANLTTLGMIYTGNAAAGTFTATSVSGKTGTSASVTVISGLPDATQSTLTPVSASITADGSSTQTLTVTAKDISGTTLTSGGSTVTITKSSGTGTIGPVTDNANGTYTATVTSPATVGSGVFLATLGGSPVKSGTVSQTQATVTYVAGALHHFAIASVSSPKVATIPFNVDITAQDINNNTVTGFGGTVALSANAGTIAPTASGSFTSGLRTESVSLTLSGTGRTIGVDDGSGHTGTSNSFTVNKEPTTGVLTTTPNPSTFEQSVTLRDSVSGSVPDGGKVYFIVDGQTVDSSNIDGTGVASAATSGMTGGSHAISAFYGGTGSFDTSTSNTVSQTVNPATPTMALSSNLDPSTLEQNVMFKVKVDNSSHTPTGSVTFYDGASSLGNFALSGDSAEVSTATLTVGVHTMKVVYGGDSNFKSDSTTIAQTVNQAAPVVLLTSSANPSTFEQNVMFKAKVHNSSNTPTGSVTFYDGASSLGSFALSGDSAEVSTSALTGGSHTIKAVYGGDGNFKSDSSTLAQVVNKKGTTNVLATSPNPSVYLQAVLFRDTVSGPPDGGKVYFSVDNAVVDSAAIDVNGVGTMSSSTLGIGSHSIQAFYGGTANFDTSRSNVVTQVVKPDTLTITAIAGAHGTITPSGSVRIERGSDQSFTITADTGYAIASVLVDSLPVGPVSIYTFTNVTATHVIQATFAIQTFTVNATAGANGSISPSGAVSVNYGSDQSFAITPDSGYFITDVHVDSVSVGEVSSYTFTHVTANHTIEASFAFHAFTVFASAGPHGTISPSGAVPAAAGGNRVFNMTPDPSYFIADVHVDSVSVGAVSQYTFTNIGADHTIQAFFDTHPVPQFKTMSPQTAYRGETVNLVLTGLNFVSGVSTLNVGAGITVNTFSVHTSDTLLANVTVGAGTAVGSRPFTVTNSAPGGGTSGPVTFTVLNHAPGAFSLSDPLNGDTIKLKAPAVPIEFRWHPSADLDAADTLKYIVILQSPSHTVLGVTTDTSFSDSSLMSLLVPQTLYTWNVLVTDGFDSVLSSQTFTFATSDSVTGVADQGKRVPKEYALHQNYPNPFNPSTTIRFDLPHRSVVTLAVYNLLGQVVATLIDHRSMDMGYQTVRWDASSIPSGVYLYRMSADGVDGKTFVRVRKMMMMR